MINSTTLTPPPPPTDHLNCKSSLLTVNIDNNEVEKVCHEYPVDYERSHQHNVGKERGQEFSFPTQQVPCQFWDFTSRWTCNIKSTFNVKAVDCYLCMIQGWLLVWQHTSQLRRASEGRIWLVRPSVKNLRRVINIWREYQNVIICRMAKDR